MCWSHVVFLSDIGIYFPVYAYIYPNTNKHTVQKKNQMLNSVGEKIEL